MSCWNIPGRSGMRTVKRISVPAPNRERSAINRRREKFIFAPERTQAYVGAPLRVGFGEGGSEVERYFFSPATDNAPAGSRIERVSMSDCSLEEYLQRHLQWQHKSHQYQQE